MRRALRLTGTLLIAAGALTLIWMVVVWQWQDPFTAVITYFHQRHLRTEYAQRSARFQATLPKRPAHGAAEAWREMEAAARRYDTTLTVGGPVGKLTIGRIGLHMVVVQGTDDESLKKGPGHYLASGLPGEGHLIYIAGHRTTYLAPFADINDIRNGDYITFQVPYGMFTYRAYRHYVVPSNALWVLRNGTTEILRLQACHPRFFATHRYIVDARLVSFTPEGTTTSYPAKTRPT